jgi:drug/metabolite transporter (DMT)-like permease
MSERTDRSRIAFWVVVVLPLIWGTTFAVVQRALTDATPMAFVVVRFATASLVILLFSRSARRALLVLLRPSNAAERTFRRHSVILAITIGAGYIFQTIGLLTTTSSKSAFLTSTAVIWTPLLSIALGRERLTVPLATAVGAALAGVFLMTHPFAEQGLVIGDVLTLGCALSFAVYIVWIERAVPNAARFAGSDVAATMMVTSTQLVLATLIFALFLPALESPRFDPTPTLLTIVVYTAVLATVVTAALQSRYQPSISPSTAAVIYMLEPVVALLIAVAFLHERMAFDDVFGSVLIVLGVIIAQVKPHSIRRRVRRSAERGRNETPDAV